MNYRETDLKLFSAIERVSEVIRSELWQVAQEQGLSPVQIRILLFVSQKDMPHVTFTDIAKNFLLTKATVSESIKRLIEKKYLKKIISKSDKRSYYLVLTKKGKDIISQLDTYRHEIIYIMSQIPEKEVIQTYYVLLQFIDLLYTNGKISRQNMCFLCMHFEKKKQGFYCNLLKKFLEIKELQINCKDFELVDDN